MGKIGDAETLEDARILARAYEIECDLPKGTIAKIESWENHWEVWE